MQFHSMLKAVFVAGLLASPVAAQTSQSGAPSPMPPGSRAGDAPGMGSIGSRSEGTALGTPATPGRPGMTEDQARNQMLAAGYADVIELQPAPDGGWRGRAMRDGRPISIAIAPGGQVTAQH